MPPATRHKTWRIVMFTIIFALCCSPGVVVVDSLRDEAMSLVEWLALAAGWLVAYSRTLRIRAKVAPGAGGGLPISWPSPNPTRESGSPAGRWKGSLDVQD